MLMVSSSVCFPDDLGAGACVWVLTLSQPPHDSNLFIFHWQGNVVFFIAQHMKQYPANSSEPASVLEIWRISLNQCSPFGNSLRLCTVKEIHQISKTGVHALNDPNPFHFSHSFHLLAHLACLPKGPLVLFHED
jgi:hypothetical protein